jgi:hypothetical protein
MLVKEVRDRVPQVNERRDNRAWPARHSPANRERYQAKPKRNPPVTGSALAARINANIAFITDDQRGLSQKTEDGYRYEQPVYDGIYHVIETKNVSANVAAVRWYGVKERGQYKNQPDYYAQHAEELVRQEWDGVVLGADNQAKSAPDDQNRASHIRQLARKCR